jgi:signal transduction histidine kinase
MPEGGILSVRAGACERSVSFELVDTGGGIPPDLDVFQPFVTSKSGAMGLGLAITRHIVETHDGTITYRSQPGKGTTFCLSFPWAPQALKMSV